MLSINVKKWLGIISRHTRILLTGFTRVVYGTLIAGTLAVSIYGFMSIPSIEGYAAVSEFVASVATLIVAITCMYALGINRKVKAERKGAK